MKILRGVYEGPGSHGILRIAASINGIHAVLRAYPGEWYFPALYGSWTRTGEPAPVTLSPVRDRPGGSWAPGDLAQDLSGVVRRRPEAETLIFARSEAALLSGEGAPILALPENPKTGLSPKLVTCEWESPSIREAEATDLSLAELVKAHAQHGPKSPSPTVNLFGPAAFGPNATAEYDEVERTLRLVGVGVNVRAPLGATVEDLSQLPRAWANVVLCRETAESTSLYLQDVFGMPRVTTPPVGSVGNGGGLEGRRPTVLPGPEVGAAGGVGGASPDDQAAMVRSAGRARDLPGAPRGPLRRPYLHDGSGLYAGPGGRPGGSVGGYVPRAPGERLSLPRPHVHRRGVRRGRPRGRRRPFEETAPDLLVGTHLEREVAEALDMPFLPLCPPIFEHSFAEKPVMGYVGSTILADALEGALREPRSRVRAEPSRSAPRVPEWTEEALEELEEIPAFLRGRARRLAEEHARTLDSPEVTPEILEESRS
jgi:light-independent protochlorophyllide reductase subunit B